VQTIDLSTKVIGPTLDLPLILLSVLLSIATAYATLEMTGRVRAGRGWSRSVWLAGGSATMGVGIWSTHYVGMLAAHLPLPVWYDWPTAILSLAAAILASTAAIYTLSYREMRAWRLVVGAVAAGGGIAASHFAANAARRLAATAYVDPRLVVASVLVSSGLWLAALYLWHRLEGKTPVQQVRRTLVCLTCMAAAPPTLHVIDLAATRYARSSATPDLAHAVTGSVLGAMAVSVVTMFVFSLAVLTAEYDRRLSQQRTALRSAERRYRQLFQRSPAGMIRVTKDGRILDSNLAAAQMFGFESPEALMAEPMGARYFDIAERNEVLARLGSEGLIRDMERAFRRKDGTVVWLVTTITAIEEGAVQVYDGMMINVSEKKRLEVDLLHAQKLEAVGSLAAGIAHEINTPVQFVSDNTRFLEDSLGSVNELVEGYDRLLASVGTLDWPADPKRWIQSLRTKADWDFVRAETPKALGQMQEGLARVAEIVRAMKEFSRVDQSPEMAMADLNKSLETTLVVARNEFKYVAEVNTKLGALPPVMCHVGDLNQVFLQLVINAAHAIEDVVEGTHTLGRIDIRTRHAGEWVEIDISDTGTGIPTDIRDKVFNPFFTTKQVGRGSGQGLTLARSIVVDRHGGMLTFDTEMGKGTTFHVRLPVASRRSTTATLAA
jgi:PAS domain S-box-containing protein